MSKSANLVDTGVCVYAWYVYMCTCVHVHMGTCVFVYTCTCACIHMTNTFLRPTRTPTRTHTPIHHCPPTPSGIVLMSIGNVILAAANIELPNAKLLRLLRLGRVVRIFKSLKNLQKIISATAASGMTGLP